MVAYQPARTVSLRLAGGVVDNVGIVVSGVVVVESVVVIAVVPVEVSEEENVAVRGEERGVASAGVVTVIVGVMESGAVAAVAEVVDAEDTPKVVFKVVFKHRRWGVVRTKSP
jgi:hypothetical protein